jgi:archaellum component FlaC
MPEDWRTEYLSNLQQAHHGPHSSAAMNPQCLLDACSSLSLSPRGLARLLTQSPPGNLLTDRIMQLQAENTLLLAQGPPPNAPTSDRPSKPTTLTGATTPSPSEDAPPAGSALARALADAAESIRARDQMRARLGKAEAELARLKARDETTSKTLTETSESKALLARRLRDRESELAEKGKLLSVGARWISLSARPGRVTDVSAQEVQNEMLAITIELTQRENEVKKYKREVESLTKQILAVKQLEVEELNRANERRR